MKLDIAFVKNVSSVWLFITFVLLFLCLQEDQLTTAPPMTEVRLRGVEK